jgi:aminoglycoside 3-N-acetyltransferase
VTLAAHLRALGLAAGDRVVVHSSLRAIGAGADETIDAFLDVLGPGGLLVMPTFTYLAPWTGPSRTGALTEVFRQREGVVRSRHRTHSVAALGHGAHELVAGHEARGPVDLDTPLDRLAASGGLILLAGVNHTSNTTIHVGEVHARAPYLDIPFSPEWAGLAERYAGCSRAFGALELPLRSRGTIRDGRLGGAHVQLVRGQAVIEATVALLAADPLALLCTDPGCYRCTLTRDRDAGARAAAADRAR